MAPRASSEKEWTNMAANSSDLCILLLAVGLSSSVSISARRSLSGNVGSRNPVALAAPDAVFSSVRLRCGPLNTRLAAFYVPTDA